VAGRREESLQESVQEDQVHPPQPRFSSKVQPVRGYRGGCSGSWVRELEERQWVRGEGAARGGAGLKVEEQRGPALGRR
jgi:hypothetical protein